MSTEAEIFHQLQAIESELDQEARELDSVASLLSVNQGRDLHQYAGAFRGDVQASSGYTSLFIQPGYVYAGKSAVYFPETKVAMLGYPGAGEYLVFIRAKVDPDTGNLSAAPDSPYYPELSFVEIADAATLQEVYRAVTIIGKVTKIADGTPPNARISEWQQRHMGNICVPVWENIEYHYAHDENSHPIWPPDVITKTYKCSWHIR